MPHTPLAVPQPGAGRNDFLRTPYTPYTPFTAFASKKNPFEAQMNGAPFTAHLLDDYDNPLANLYNSILKFVERDLKQVMDIAEKVHTKSTSRAPADANVDQPTFNILANVIWTEVDGDSLELTYLDRRKKGKSRLTHVNARVQDADKLVAQEWCQAVMTAAYTGAL